jgi:hypothetical protein
LFFIFDFYRPFPIFRRTGDAEMRPPASGS